MPPSPEPQRRTLRNELPDTLYSNSDRVLNHAVITELSTIRGTCALHAAWNFCAYVHFDHDDREWVSEVHSYGRCVDVIHGNTPLEVIEAANLRWGSE